MDDLIGGVLLIAAVAMVVAAAIAIAVAMAAAGGAVGGVIVAGRGIGVFVGSVSRAITLRGEPNRKPTPPEPAFELYVLGQFKRDLAGAFGEAWQSMQLARSHTSQWADKLDGMLMPLGIGAVVGGYLGTVLGTVIGGLLAVPVVILAGSTIGLSWALIGILRLAELIRRRIRHARYECPIDHERFPLPTYVCPACHVEHRGLVPGRWGIFKRECECRRTALPRWSSTVASASRSGAPAATRSPA
jgi:hypothetical protein